MINQISFRNVNIKAKSLKDGMKYEFSAEITQEDFDELRNADLTGSVAEANVEWVTVNVVTPVAAPEKKGGPLARSAGQLCENDTFQKFMGENYSSSDFIAVDPPGRTAILVRELCRIDSRAELDHNEAAAKRFHELMREYRQYVETMEGKA